MIGRTSYSSGFIGEFKTGDNIAFNCRILCDLACYNEGGRFNKMIYLQAAAIIEACLSEIIFRAQTHTIEGVPTISAEEQNKIRQKKYDKLSNFIEAMKKYKILDGLGGDVYDKLHELRKIRNKVHIQEFLDPNEFPRMRNESDIFTNARTQEALDLTKRIMRHLGEKYRRPAHVTGYVSEFQLPNSIAPDANGLAEMDGAALNSGFEKTFLNAGRLA